MISVLNILIRIFDAKDAEFLREIRNESCQFLFNKNIITKEEQSKWLLLNDFDKNTFYTVEYKNEVIGFLNVKKTEYIDELETGILFKKQYQNHHAPAAAVIAMTYFLFTKTNIYTLISYVHKENKNAVELNIKLGFKYTDDFNKDFLKMNLQRQKFLAVYYQKFKKLKITNNQ